MRPFGRVTAFNAGPAAVETMSAFTGPSPAALPPVSAVSHTQAAI